MENQNYYFLKLVCVWYLPLSSPSLWHRTRCKGLVCAELNSFYEVDRLALFIPQTRVLCFQRQREAYTRTPFQVFVLCYAPIWSSGNSDWGVGSGFIGRRAGEKEAPLRKGCWELKLQKTNKQTNRKARGGQAKGLNPGRLRAPWHVSSTSQSKSAKSSLWETQQHNLRLEKKKKNNRKEPGGNYSSKRLNLNWKQSVDLFASWFWQNRKKH